MALYDWPSEFEIDGERGW